MAGTFEQDGVSLHFNTAATTMMACPEPVMKQERAFTTALQSVTTYGIKGRNLELLAGGKVVARFRAEDATPSSK
jgi:heat shock protein HslJ